MRLSVMQMNPGADTAANIDQAGRVIGEAIAADCPDLISLPVRRGMPVMDSRRLA